MSYHVKDGEFKRRIEELLDYLECNGHNDGFYVEERDTEKFWDIFIDAWKDFPDVAKSKDEVSSPIEIACREWFVKWLGLEGAYYE